MAILIFFGIIVLAFVCLLIICSMPMVRFLNLYHDAISMKKVFLMAAKTNFKNKKVSITCNRKYKFIVTSSVELLLQYEGFLNSALKYYDEHRNFLDYDYAFRARKAELVNIISEIRTLRYRMEKE